MSYVRTVEKWIVLCLVLCYIVNKDFWLFLFDLRYIIYFDDELGGRYAKSSTCTSGRSPDEGRLLNKNKNNRNKNKRIHSLKVKHLHYKDTCMIPLLILDLKFNESFHTVIL